MLLTSVYGTLKIFSPVFILALGGLGVAFFYQNPAPGGAEIFPQIIQLRQQITAARALRSEVSQAFHAPSFYSRIELERKAIDSINQMIQADSLKLNKLVAAGADGGFPLDPFVEKYL